MNTQTAKWSKVFRTTVMATLTALVVQFILGMMINLDVPRADTSALTSVHIILGTLLLVLAILAFAFALPAHSKQAVWISMIGFLLIVISWGSGEAFLLHGQNSMSLMMALGFIAATVVYSMGLSMGRR